MNKLKIFALTISALALLTACGGGNDSEETTAAPAPEITAGSETPEETAADSEDGDLIADEEDINIDELFPAGDSSDNTASPGEDLPGEEVSDNPLMPIIDKVLAESEWPVMMEVTDETILADYFLLDNSDGKYEQLIVMQCPMSAQMSEIIIIKAEDTKAAFEALGARRQKAIDTDAWYPADKELADASIVGSNGSYAYFIIGVNAEAAEKSILDYILEGAPID